MKSDETMVDAYVKALPADRREAITRVRATINANLPAGYEEGMQFGMPAWFVPLERYPETYNKQPLMLAALASQRTHMAVYLLTVYGNPELSTWFTAAYAATGKKLDMGKSCVRFKTLDALPVDLIGEVIAKVSVDRYIASYEASLNKAAAKPAPAKRRTAPKASTRGRAAPTGRSRSS